MKRLKETLLLIIFILSIGPIYSQVPTIPVIKKATKAKVEHEPIKLEQQNSTVKRKVTKQKQNRKKKLVEKTSGGNYSQFLLTDDQRIEITSVQFKNVNSKSETITEYGGYLYTNINYLKPKIYYKSLSHEKKGITLFVKIFNPDGTLKSGKDSPVGYSYSCDLDVPERSETNHYFELSGWGNEESTSYTTSGNYKLEVWCLGKKIFETNIEINQLPEVKPEIYLSVSTQSVSYTALGGTAKITVNTNADSYNVDDCPNWCTIKKYKDNFVITCNSNDQYSTREGLVYVKAGDKIQKINISQEKGIIETKPEVILSVSQQFVSFTSSGGTEKITVYTNADSYNVVNHTDWCTIKRYNDYFIISCQNNNNYFSREGLIAIKVGAKMQNININQDENVYRTPKCFNCPKGDKHTVGFSLGYTSKQWVSKSGTAVQKFGYWDDKKNVDGIQAGIRIEPLFKGGFGINTGLFYEFFYSESSTMTGNYSDTNEAFTYNGIFEEHSLYVPFDLEYRFNFSKHFNIFFYGGISADIGISGKVTATETGQDQPYYTEDNFYGNSDLGNLKRLNYSLDFGGGMRIGRVQINAGASHGLYNMHTEDDIYTEKQNKNLMISLSYMF